MTRTTLCIAPLTICLCFGATRAQAIPILQLYLEGGSYDAQTESWTITPLESPPGEPYRLWAIGNLGGPG